MAVFCARRKIPMLPCYLLRTESGFELHISEPIWLDKDLPPKDRIHDLLVKMNKEFERIIKAHPEQWFLMHRRFKRVKVGERGNGKKISHSVYRPRRNNKR
jgi:KDO2-lipid IV(A) lauroyltransferase